MGQAMAQRALEPPLIFSVQSIGAEASTFIILCNTEGRAHFAYFEIGFVFWKAAEGPILVIRCWTDGCVHFALFADWVCFGFVLPEPRSGIILIIPCKRDGCVHFGL